MLVSALVLSVFSLGLSRTNLVNQVAFQNKMERESIYTKYGFELPQSVYFEPTYQRYYAHDLKLVVDSSKPSVTVLLSDHQEIPISYLYQELVKHSSKFHEAERSKVFARLFIDKRVRIDFVEKVKRSIAKAGVSKIYYMVVPENPEFDVRFYHGLGIPSQVLVYDYFEPGSPELGIPPPPGVYKEPQMTVSSIKIQIDSDSLDLKRLVDRLAHLKREQPYQIIRYNYNPQDPFWKYLNMLSATFEATNIVREEVFSTRVDSNMNYYEKEELREKINLEISMRFSAIPKK